jgi:hypothetical protein
MVLSRREILVCCPHAASAAVLGGSLSAANPSTSTHTYCNAHLDLLAASLPFLPTLKPLARCDTRSAALSVTVTLCLCSLPLSLALSLAVPPPPPTLAPPSTVIV